MKTTMCGEMVTINAGHSVQTLEEAAEEFFSSIVEKRIFPEMLRLTRELESTKAAKSGRFLPPMTG